MSQLTKLAAGKPFVIAHRGSSGTEPENTIPAFLQAIRQGADVVELDVRLSADGVVVVCHSAEAGQTTDGNGNIASMTWDEIQQLDAAYRFTRDGGMTFPLRGRGYRIPAFEEALKALASVPLLVDIKDPDPMLAKKCLLLLSSFGRSDDVAIPYVMPAWVREQSPERPGFLTRLPLGQAAHVFEIQSPTWLMPNGLTREFVRHLHGLGIPVDVPTVNEEAQMRRYVQLKVDGIYSNFPGLLRQVVDSVS